MLKANISPLRLGRGTGITALKIAVVSLVSVYLWHDGFGKVSSFMGSLSPQAGLGQNGTVPQPVLAGLVSWPGNWGKASQETGGGGQLVFTGAKIAPNGNGIFSGMARPGYKIILKDSEKKVAFSRSDPEGQWVAIVKNPVSDSTRVYSLHSTSPDSRFRHEAEQELQVEIPYGNKKLARIRILEKGKRPVILAQNLTVTAVDTAKGTGGKDNVTISETGYEVGKDGQGRISLSGTAGKNASLKVFVNEKEAGTVKAGKDGKWKFLAVHDIKPGSSNMLRIEQRGSDDKVINEVSAFFDREGRPGRKEGGGAAKDGESSLWKKVTGLFSATEKPEGEGEGDKIDKGDSDRKVKGPADKGAVDVARLQEQQEGEGGDQASEKTEGDSPAKGGSKVAGTGTVPGKGENSGSDKPGTEKNKGESPFTNEKPGVSEKTGIAVPAKKKSIKKHVKTRRVKRRLAHRRGKKARRRYRKSRSRSARRRARRVRLASLKRRRVRNRRARSGSRKSFRSRSRAAALYRRRRNFRKKRLRLRKRRQKSLGRVVRSARRIRSIKRSRRIRVRSGDTLWNLAKIRYGHGRYYKKIYRANKKMLGNPNRLLTNQRLFLPA